MIKYLYRKLRWSVTLALLLPVPALLAQWGAPAPRPVRKTARATAVVETYQDGSQRLIPVSFFYEQHFYDANLYRAAPVPFTLAPQTVYEVQQFGKALGTFTVQNASRSASTTWVASGRFKAAPRETEVASKKPVAPVVVRDPQHPVLHRREGSDGDQTAPSNRASQHEDADRPKLHRRGEEATAGRRSAAEPPPADDEERPVLRRGKPERQSGADLAANETAPPLTLLVAVSDAGASEPRDLHFPCSDAQRQQMQDEARQLALSELQRLSAERGVAQPQAVNNAMAKPAAAADPAAIAGLDAQDEQFAVYDLDNNDHVTIVYSARFARPAADATKPENWVVMIVARQDRKKVVKLFSAVSDPRELELYPEMRLVDAVDPDGHGRYALLLREQKRDGVSWLLGRVNGYDLQKLFETATR